MADIVRDASHAETDSCPGFGRPEVGGGNILSSPELFQNRTDNLAPILKAPASGNFDLDKQEPEKARRPV
jgi:hypothetical protein